MEDLREKEASRPLLKYMYNATLFKKNSFMLGGIVQEKCFKEMKIEKTICGFIFQKYMTTFKSFQFSLREFYQA